MSGKVAIKEMPQTVDSPKDAELVSREEMIRRIKSFQPVVRERAEEAESLRRMPPDTFHDLRKAKIFRTAQPVAYGGAGLDMDTVYEIAFELARADPSTGWNAAFYALHAHQVGMFGRETQEEYWADSYDVMMATASGVVKAEFEDTPKGVRVSGAWDFASGIDQADWLQLNRPIPSNTSAEQLLIPKKDFKIVDNWHTAGARATGSKRVVIEEAFVPPHRVLDAALMSNGHTPGRDLHPSRYYKLPIFPWMSYVIASAIMGAAQGMVDLFTEQAGRRREMTTGERFVERAANQLRVAEASAEMNAARQILFGDIKLFHEWADANYEPTLLERATVRRNTGYCVKLSLQAAYRLFEVGGAHAIYNVNAMQRFYRDVSTMSHSIAVVWDPIWEQYGRLLWGLPQSSYIL